MIAGLSYGLRRSFTPWGSGAQIHADKDEIAGSQSS